MLAWVLWIAAPEVVEAPGEPLPLIVVAPRRTPRLAALEEALATVLATESGLRLAPSGSPDRDCSGDLGCMFDAAGRPTRGLLVLSYLAADRPTDPDSVTAILVEPDPRGGAPNEIPLDRLPMRLFDPDVDTFARGLLDALRARWVGSEVLAPRIELTVVGLREGDRVQISGLPAQPVGDRVVVRGLGPGAHRVEIESEAGRRMSFARELAAGEDWQVERSPPDLLPPRAITWIGAGLVAAGLGVMTFAALETQDLATDACVGPPSGCRTPRFVRVSFDRERPTDVGAGPLVLPLGVALAVTGGSFALGAELFGEPEETPWWSIAVGVALGALSYGAFELADAASR